MMLQSGLGAILCKNMVKKCILQKCTDWGMTSL